MLVFGGRSRRGGVCRSTCAGETAARGLLEPGDQLRSVNDVSLDALNHFDAWNVLKRLPNGPVRFRINRLTNSGASM